MTSKSDVTDEMETEENFVSKLLASYQKDDQNHIRSKLTSHLDKPHSEKQIKEKHQLGEKKK